MNFIIETKTELANTQIAHVLVSAFENGGISYWADIKKLFIPEGTPCSKRPGWVVIGSEDWPRIIAAPLLNDGYIEIIDYKNNNKNFIVNRQAIARGLHLMANGEHRRHFNEILEGEYDDNTADVLIQLSVFGEVKYC